MSGIEVFLVVLAIIVFIGLLIFIGSIRIVRQTNKYVVERLGAYHTTWTVGFHILVPFIDRVTKIVTMKEQVKDFDPQPVITKDNVTMQIDTVVFFTITDAKLYAYGEENPLAAIENLSATTLRNIIGDLDLDETLTSRDIINSKMRATLDEATDPWGIKVNRVEVKNILPPKDIRDAMERQMRAERERREKILLAEGEKKSAILLAEGKKESEILNAEADKKAAIMRAQGQAESTLTIKRAEADALIMVKQAEAQGIEAIKKASPSEAVLKIKQYEAMMKVSEGQATKIIIPGDMQNIASMATAIKEVIKDK